MGSSAKIMHVASEKILNLETLNWFIQEMKFVVQSPLYLRAQEIEKELKQGDTKPFKRLIHGSLGDLHAMGQSPLTFIRQVLALINFPELNSVCNFPADVVKKAKDLLDSCEGRSVGAYTDGPGIGIIRKHAAAYLERRDGFPSHYNDIILSTGATEAARQFLKLFMNAPGKKVGIMVPIPQYPLYSCAIEEFGLHQINYYLDEESDWSVNIKDLHRILNDGKGKCSPRVIVIINPGNPTGQVLSKKNVEDIIKFAYREKLIILADEVYQENVYGCKFHSFKKVMMELGEPYSKIELASFFSASKGFAGECGLRGGFSEVINIDPAVKRMLIKSVNAKSCPTIYGQIVIDCITDHPVEGSPSYPLYKEQRSAILQSLMTRAAKITEGLNNVQGLSCNRIQGALYAFPKITLPNAAVKAAKLRNMQPDELYAFELLEETGIFILPGSAFGQQPGTFHFRTTILPPEEDLDIMMEKLQKFQGTFLKKYSEDCSPM